MARSKHSELAAGLFVVFALGAGLAALIWLGAAKMFEPEGQTVYFAAPIDRGNLGLDIGSIVKIGNAWAGQVEQIYADLPRKRAIVVAKLSLKDAHLRVNARAVAVSDFIGGTSIIIENMGEPNSPAPTEDNPVLLAQGPNAMLRQAQEIIGFGKEQQTQFQQILADVAVAVDNVKSISVSLAAEMDAKNKDALLAQIKELVAGLQQSANNLAKITGNVLPETDKNDPNSIIAKIDVTASVLADNAKTSVTKILADLREVSSTARDLLVLNRDRLDEMTANLASMAENLSAAAKEIRRNPWRLLQQPGDKDVRTQNLYDAARAFSEGARQLDDAIARLKALREIYPAGAPAEDPEVVKVRRQLEETFKKFREAENALWQELTK